LKKRHRIPGGLLVRSYRTRDMPATVPISLTCTVYSKHQDAFTNIPDVMGISTGTGILSSGDNVFDYPV
jgi:hypothetical protein